MDSKEKIGVGIVTCNRPQFFLKCFKSIPKGVELVVVNDGSNFEDWQKLLKDKDFTYIHNKQNLGVGKSKNILFKELLKKKCDHIFIIEDDIIVKDPNVFSEYIKARNITGIQHFNFGYHGPANRGNVSKGAPNPRFIVDYGEIKIAINMHSVGAFCYYTKEVLEKVGLLDEEYTNAFEHVDHDYRIANAGYCTPYWNWPDLANSCDYLDEVECSEKSSSIRPRSDWQSNIQKGAATFQKKHTFLPAWQNCVPDSTPVIVKRIMKTIFNKHSKQKNES
jgi:GT2 family glycosyltransferase